MPGIGIGLGLGLGGGAGGNGPTARSATVGAAATGAVYAIGRLLGTTSSLSLIAGTNGNLSLSGSSIAAAAALGSGNSQKAMVREALGDLAIEYPVTLTGAIATPAPTPTPTPAPTPTPTAAFSTAKLQGDSRSNNSGGRSVGTTTAVGHGITSFSTTGFMQMMCGNKWIWPEGYQHAIGASTTLAMVERNKSTSIALTGNPAYDTTQNTSDQIFSRDSDGATTVRTQPGAHIFQLSGVNDDGGAAGPAYYNVPFKASKTIRDTAADLDLNLAASKLVFMANGCPTTSTAFQMEARAVSGGTCSPSVTTNFTAGDTYGAPGVVGQFADGIRVLTKVASNPGQDQYTITGTTYAFGGTAPTTAYLTYDAAASLSPTSDHVKALHAWYNSNAANFVWNGNDYGTPGMRYNRPNALLVDSMKWLRADVNDGATMRAKPGTMDVLKLHHYPLGAFWYAKAVKEAVDAAYPAAPSLDKRPTRNNWYAAVAGGTTNPTLTCTLPPSMRVVTPTELWFGGVKIGTVNISTGAITGTNITAGSLNFTTGAFTVTFSGTPANGTRLHVLQDIGDGAGVGLNLVLNGLLDMTPLDGTNIAPADKAGVSSIAGISNAQVPAGWTLSAANLATPIANGLASVAVSIDTYDGFPRFNVTAAGIATAAGTIALQSAAYRYPNLMTSQSDKMVAGATVSEDAGANGWLYGFGGTNIVGSIASTPGVTRTGPSGDVTSTILTSSTRSALGALPLDSSILAANGGPLVFHRIGPQISLAGATPTANSGSMTISLAFQANQPFSFKVGMGQAHHRSRTDV